MERKHVLARGAPAPIGPYAQGIVCGELVFCSGQLGLDPSTGKLVSEDVSVQAERAIRNLSEVLAAAGVDLSSVVRTTLYLTDMEDFGRVNEVYARYFGEAKPARTTVGVSSLPKGGKVEIDAVAVSPKKV